MRSFLISWRCMKLWAVNWTPAACYTNSSDWRRSLRNIQVRLGFQLNLRITFPYPFVLLLHIFFFTSRGEQKKCKCWEEKKEMFQDERQHSKWFFVRNSSDVCKKCRTWSLFVFHVAVVSASGTELYQTCDVDSVMGFHAVKCEGRLKSFCTCFELYLFSKEMTSLFYFDSRQN